MPVTQKSLITVLIEGAGGLGIVVILLGLVLTAWGVFNLFKVRSRILLLLQAFLSFAPLVAGLTGMLSRYAEFSQLAASPTAPKPGVLGETITGVFACGVLGGLATIVPALIGTLALGLKAGRPAK